MFQQLRDRLKLMSSEPHVLYWFALLSSLLRLRFSMLADTARVTNIRIIIIINWLHLSFQQLKLV